MENKVTFRVAGSELSAYIDNIQKRSDDLSAKSVRGAIEQVNKGKDLLKVIEDQVKAIEKKNKIDILAGREAVTTAKNLTVEQIRAKQKANNDFLDSKVGKAGYSEDWINTRRENVNQKADADVDVANKQHREQLKSVKEQERQAKLQTTLARENIETLRQTAQDNVKAISNGDLKLADVISGAQTDDEKLVARLTEQDMADEKKNKDRENGGKSIVGSLLAVDNLNRLLTSAGQVAGSQNGFDMIKPAASMAGQLIGGAIGAAIGAFAGGVGAVAGAGVGASLGGTIGGTTGELFQRSAMAKQDYQRSQGRWKGVTGGELPETTNTEKFGVNVTDFLKLQTDFAIKRGESGSASKTATDALYADKGYGVEQGTSGSLVEMLRSAKEGNKDLAVLIGGIIQKGQGSIFKNGDHTFLNEFLGKFVGLQKELLKTQSNVASGTTMDILTKFNKLGGEWDSKDPRSQGNISTVQNGLSNPGTDNLKALSFGVLRKLMPNASIFEILKERQKGFGSPAYLKGMFGAVDQIGGDDSQKQLNLSGMFPGLSLSAVSRMYQHKGDLMSGKISIENLKSKFSKEDWGDKAQGNTAEIDKSKANIDNSLLQDKYATIEALASAFKTAIESSMSGAVIQLNESRGTISFPTKAVIKQGNATKKAGEQKATDDYNRRMKQSGLEGSLHIM